MAENAFHIYMLFRNDICKWANVLSSGKFSQDNDLQIWIIKEAYGAADSSLSFIFNDELVSKSICFICILLFVFIFF